MTKALPALIVLACLVASGAVAGAWTDRWQPDLDASRLSLQARLPASAGDWAGQDEPAIPGELEAARVAAIDRKIYQHAGGQRSASVALVAGRGRPVSVHTPEVCYPNSGFLESGPAKRVEVPAANAKVWVRRFSKPGPVPHHVAVYYAWSDGGPWEAPDNPRLRYARKPVMFKLYVATEVPPEDRAGGADPLPDLLAALLPLVPATP